MLLNLNILGTILQIMQIVFFVCFCKFVILYTHTHTHTHTHTEGINNCVCRMYEMMISISVKKKE